jgi:hypothetical protein
LLACTDTERQREREREREVQGTGDGLTTKYCSPGPLSTHVCTYTSMYCTMVHNVSEFEFGERGLSCFFRAFPTTTTTYAKDLSWKI